jgi:hypothetical protein
MFSNLDVLCDTKVKNNYGYLESKEITLKDYL